MIGRVRFFGWKETLCKKNKTKYDEQKNFEWSYFKKYKKLRLNLSTTPYIKVCPDTLPLSPPLFPPQLEYDFVNGEPLSLLKIKYTTLV